MGNQIGGTTEIKLYRSTSSAHQVVKVELCQSNVNYNEKHYASTTMTLSDFQRGDILEVCTLPAEARDRTIDDILKTRMGKAIARDYQLVL